MDFSKLSTGDKVIGGSGIALLLFSFFPWFEFDGGGFFTISQSGWHFFLTGIVPTLLGLVMVAWVVATKLADIDLPEMPVEEGLLLLALGGAAAILIILRLLIGGDDGGTDALDRTFWVFLATLAGIGLAGGGFLKFQEGGGQMPGGSSGSSTGDSGNATPF